MCGVDKNFTVEYIVVIRVYDTKDVKIINHYSNLGLKVEYIDDFVAFEQPFKTLQDAIKCYIVQQEFYNVDTTIICEYFYNNETVGAEYVTDIGETLKIIADKRLKEEIAIEKTINLKLNDTIKFLEPIMQLPTKNINAILEYVRLCGLQKV